MPDGQPDKEREPKDFRDGTNNFWLFFTGKQNPVIDKIKSNMGEIWTKFEGTELYKNTAKAVMSWYNDEGLELKQYRDLCLAAQKSNDWAESELFYKKMEERHHHDYRKERETLLEAFAYLVENGADPKKLRN